MVRRHRRIRIWLLAMLLPLAIADLVLDFSWPVWRQTYHDWSIGIFAACVALLAPMLKRRAHRVEQLTNSYRSFHVTVIPDSITIAAPPRWSRTLERTDVVRAEEPVVGGGLYIRSNGRYRWMIIPRSLDDYAEIRDLLPSLGIPVVRTKVPPNTEEFLGVLVFCASILCDLFAHSPGIKMGNLVVSAAIAVGGLIVIRRGWENDPRRLKAQIGCFLPLLGAAVAFFWR